MGMTDDRDETRWPPKPCLDAIEDLILYSDQYGQAGMDETATPNDRLRIARSRNEACGRLHDAIVTAITEAERRGRKAALREARAMVLGLPCAAQKVDAEDARALAARLLEMATTKDPTR